MGKKKKLIITLIIIISILVVAVIAGMIVYTLYKKTQEKPDDIITINFNQVFMKYEGNNIPLDKIKTLINDIIQSNTDNPEHQITVKIISQGVNEETNDPATLVTVIDTLNSEYNFSVFFEYDNEGYINLITIDQNVNIPTEQMEILEFNKQFTQYEGENISATLAKSLLTAILENNNINETHQIIAEIKGTNLESGTIKIKDLAEIQEIIVDPDRYKTEFEYDEDYYVSKVIVEKLENTISNEEETNNTETTLQKLEKYQGKIITGKELKENLVNIIKTYNKENPENKINIYSSGLKSITEIKDESNYEITISYNNEDYPTRVDALEK